VPAVAPVVGQRTKLTAADKAEIAKRYRSGERVADL